jgi:hypothetical protein
MPPSYLVIGGYGLLLPGELYDVVFLIDHILTL